MQGNKKNTIKRMICRKEERRKKESAYPGCSSDDCGHYRSGSCTLDPIFG